jgi:hypothetical protein
MVTAVSVTATSDAELTSAPWSRQHHHDAFGRDHSAE